MCDDHCTYGYQNLSSGPTLFKPPPSPFFSVLVVSARKTVLVLPGSLLACFSLHYVRDGNEYLPLSSSRSRHTGIRLSSC